MVFKKIFTTLSLFLLVDFCWGQINKQILFDQLYIPGIIAQNPINDITQDHNGLMWFCTNDGIHRYNGYTFETFNPNYANLALSFKKILPLNDSLMLVGTVNADLLKFNSHSYKFTPASSDSHVSGSIENILKDSTGSIWVDCGNIGLYQYANDTLRLFNKDTVDAMAITPTGRLQYGTRNTLKEINGGEPIVVGQLPKDHIITSIGYNGSNIWLGTLYHGLYEIGTKGIVKLINLNESRVNAILQDRHLNLWVLTNNDGVFLYSRGKFKQLQRKFYNKNSLTSDRSLSIYQDTNDIIWIGTGNGINKYDPYKNKFEIYRHDPLDESSISSDIIRGVYEDKAGNVWIGSEDGAINKLDSTKTKFLSRRISLPGVPKVIPYGFYELSAKEMLVATSNGCLIVSKDLKKIRPHPILTYEALESSRARTIVPYKNDTLLILAQGKIFIYDIANESLNQLKLKTGKPNLPDQAVDTNARAIHVDEAGDVWIGSYGAIAKIDLATQNARYFTFSDNRGPMVMYINKIENIIWIGTFNGGLVKLNALNDTFKVYTTHHGMPNNSAYAAIPDSNNNLWVSSNEGISRFNITKETFLNFDINDGLQGQEFNRLAYCKRKNGEIIMGGINGLNVFHPEYVKTNSNRPESVILSVEILNEFAGENEALHPNTLLLDQKQVTLSYEQNFLQFNFCSSHFSSPTENKFYYQLENFDENWIYADTRNTATYTGLEHGSYVFKVKSISPDGLEERHYASINVNIEAPFWMSWWFYLGTFLVVILFGYLAINRRLSKNKVAKVLLEEEIERRTKELKLSKDELSHLNENKDFILSILSHDLRSPLTTLEGFLGLIINYYDQMKPDEIKLHAEAIKNSVGKLLDLIDNTLYWSMSQMGSTNFNPVKISVPILFERVKGLYELTAQKKYIKLEFDHDHDLSIHADENMTYIIIRNLVSNAIKFSPENKTVEIKAKRIDDMVSISISDEGTGISPDHMEKLFDQKPNLSKKGTSNEKGAGLGLILCKKFTDLNKGSITAESSLNGTTFEVRLPSA